MELPLNYLLPICWVVGLVVNWAVPTWQFNLKNTVANFFVMLLAFIVTQWFITATPHAVYWKVVYVVFAVAFCAAPIDLYQLIVTAGKQYYTDYIKSKTKTTTTTTETTETTKSAGGPPPMPPLPGA
jgi:hypothetical protein